MDPPQRKEGEDFWTCYQSVLTNYAPSVRMNEQESLSEDEEEIDPNQNDATLVDMNRLEEELSEDEDDDQYNSEVEEQVLKRCMKEDIKEYGTWSFFDDDSDDASEVTPLQQLRYELREAVEQMLDMHFGVVVEKSIRQATELGPNVEDDRGSLN